MTLKLVKDSLTKYHFKTKDKQRVNIEHKNQQIVLDLFKWGEEVSLQILLDKVLASNHTFSDNKIEVENPDLLLRVYPIDTRSTGDLYGDSDDLLQCHDGGLRFELVFKKKRPAMSNSFLFPLVVKNLRCAYQPFLTEEEIASGIVRPLNVEGSYAFYHISKKDNQYRTGKAFHIYRPIAEDALGNKAWCDLYIDGDVNPTSLTVTVPQQFLDEAVYPIIVDPDLGYTAIGGATTDIDDRRVGSAWTMPAGGGTVNYMRAYVQGSADTGDAKAIINQKDSGGAGTHGQIAGPVENLNFLGAAHWEEFTFAGEGLVGGTVYILNINGNASIKQTVDIYYDSDGATAVASYNETEAYNGLESPWVVNPEGTTRDYSIFANYSVGWVGTISGVANPAEVQGVARTNIAEVKGVA